MRKIDHLVYSVPNLEEAIKSLEEKLGIPPVFGGYHLTKGTKNALLNLGKRRYLEILAIDTANTKVKAPRWMGIDLINTPQFTRWSIKSNRLKKDREILKDYHQKMGFIQGGQRKMSDGNLLTWEMILPLASPRVELIPFMTDWQQSDNHPTQNLDNHCELLELILTHPHPNLLENILSKLSIDIKIQQRKQISIHAKIKCPKGEVIL